MLHPNVHYSPENDVIPPRWRRRSEVGLTWVAALSAVLLRLRSSQGPVTSGGGQA